MLLSACDESTNPNGKNLSVNIGFLYNSELTSTSNNNFTIPLLEKAVSEINDYDVKFSVHYTDVGHDDSAKIKNEIDRLIDAGVELFFMELTQNELTIASDYLQIKKQINPNINSFHNTQHIAYQPNVINLLPNINQTGGLILEYLKEKSKSLVITLFEENYHSNFFFDQLKDKAQTDNIFFNWVIKYPDEVSIDNVPGELNRFIRDSYDINGSYENVAILILSNQNNISIIEKFVESIDIEMPLTWLLPAENFRYSSFFNKLENKIIFDSSNVVYYGLGNKVSEKYLKFVRSIEEQYSERVLQQESIFFDCLLIIKELLLNEMTIDSNNFILTKDLYNEKDKLIHNKIDSYFFENENGDIDYYNITSN